MEFFRWFLILAGIAMLAVTYMLGRRKVDSIDYRRRVAEEDEFDPSFEDLSVPISGRPSEDVSYDGVDEIRYEDSDAVYVEADEFPDEFLSDAEIDGVLPAKTTNSYDADARDMGLEDDTSDSALRRGTGAKVKSFASAVKQANQRKERGDAIDFSSEFESYPEEVMDIDQVAEIDQVSDIEQEEKIVTVNITARNQKFNGADLKRVFEAHGYKFGKMSIYHCSLEQKKVFSVANLVKPGSFDVDNMDSFTTPGITLFMRLPVTLDADVAFDFLIREATDLAEELGGQLRDADRSTLSKQTIQHMREEIQQYVFRQQQAVQA